MLWLAWHCSVWRMLVFMCTVLLSFTQLLTRSRRSSWRLVGLTATLAMSSARASRFKWGSFSSVFYSAPPIPVWKPSTHLQPSHSRLCWRWDTKLPNVLLRWRQWGQVSEATRTTTQWLCLRSCQHSTRNPIWHLKARNASLRMVSGHFLSPLRSVQVISVCVSVWRVASCRLSGVGAHRSCGGITKWNQGDCDGASGDVQRGPHSLLCGCTKRYKSVGCPSSSQGEECWLHVSSDDGTFWILPFLYVFWMFWKIAFIV